METKKTNKSLKIVILVLAILLLLAGLGGGLYYYEDHLVYKNATVEAGVEVSVADFLIKEDEAAYFSEASDKVDTAIPGQYQLLIHSKGFDHACLLIVEDTIAPKLEVGALSAGYGTSFRPEEFVTKSSDATELTFSYKKEPNYKQDGEQKVTIVATDLGGNSTEATTTLTLCPVRQEITIEAGSALPDVKEYLLDDSIEGAKYVAEAEENDTEAIDLTKLGKYQLTIAIENRQYPVSLIVKDTIAPEFTTRNIEGYNIVARAASSFVTEYTDATEVTFSYKEEPDFTRTGQQSVTIVARDAAGNETEKEASMNLYVDTEAPVIYGANNMTSYLGNRIAYRNYVSASDNCPEGLELSIDSDEVNINKEGVYTVYCTARDAAGNVTTASFQVTVMKRIYSEAEVNAMADQLLAGFITGGMSQADKVSAIYYYIRSYLRYYDYSDKSTWYQCAGEAIEKHKGDCYSYATLSKVLLTRAGITNMDIGRIPDGDNLHYWNLVDIGDGNGWYHFDTTPRAGEDPHVLFCTDAYLADYSARHGNCYNYDRSVYTGIY